MAERAPGRVDSLIGRDIGNFRIDALLGQGGMGAVYRAWDLSLDRPVALKTVLLDNAHTRALFVRESRAQAKLRHPNVVPVHFVGEHEGLTYLVMELVEGESLAAMIEREKRLSEERALEIVDAVAAALEAALAEGLIHRDVKPSNVLVEKKSGRILLADFGLARAIGAALPDDGGAPSPDATVTKGAIGTPAYIAPELTSGVGPVDHRADIYSLGVTFYEIVTGTRPFGAPTNSRLAAAHEHAPVIEPRVIVPDLSEETENLILRMLVKAPGGRLPDYAQLRRAIAGIHARRFLAPLLPRAGAFVLDLLPFALLDAALTQRFPNGEHRVLVWWLALLVFAWFESKRGATWGKQLVGVHTLTDVGERVPFGNAIVRTYLKLLAPLTIAMIYSAFAILARKHVSHVDIHNRRMLAIVAFACVQWIGLMLLAVGKRRAAFHDRMVKSRVVVDVGAARTRDA
ncbi:MAG: protein kinase [Labilithrix sp.]|nr:protein kinase [Labilithrix sp.]MCW5810291.1 protein kinase [Labilithrix sp.]